MVPARVWRHGSDEDLPPRRMLCAGPLVLFREGAEICSVMLGEKEILRRIYSAVRDRNWGTIRTVLSNLREEAGKDTFRISFDADHHEGPIHFTWKGLITGAADGTVTYTLDGVARSTFLKNRIGFCVLHPDTCAGAPCRVEHAGGGVEESSFPARISPHQPFLDIRSMSHEVSPGLWAEVSFEGDIFETEDQRNWTDASFKTYCTPLSLPFPAEIREGTRICQSVTLRLRPSTPHAPPARLRRERVYQFDASAPGRPLPLLGLGAASHPHELSRREISLLSALRLDHLRVDLDLSRSDAPAVLSRAAREASMLGARLELALFLSDEAARELDALRDLVKETRCGVARWLVFHNRESCTSEKWVARARQILAPAAPDAPFVSGTNAYFTELNRGSPPGPSSDGLVYSINPQIHAFDNASIMETLSAQPATVQSARAIGGQRLIFISPVTLKPRFNAVATGPIAEVPAGELPPQVDPRQMSLFAAAWTLGTLAGLARAEVAGITFFETTGWQGVMETAAGPTLPQRFRSSPGWVFPVYHVLADVAEIRGPGSALCAQPAGEGGPPEISGLTIRRAGKLLTLLANLTPAPVSLRAKGGAGRARVRYLDETTAEQACRSPSDFRSRPAEMVTTTADGLELKLLPYAVARVDWEA